MENVGQRAVVIARSCRIVTLLGRVRMVGVVVVSLAVVAMLRDVDTETHLAAVVMMWQTTQRAHSGQSYRHKQYGKMLSHISVQRYELCPTPQIPFSRYFK